MMSHQDLPTFLVIKIVSGHNMKYDIFSQSNAYQFDLIFTKYDHYLYLGLVVTKPVFGVSYKTSFKPVSSATETS